MSGHFTKKVAATAMLLLAFEPSKIDATAAEIRLLCSINMRATVSEIAGEFERATGHKLLSTYDSTGALERRILAGETADAIIAPKATLQALMKVDRIRAGSMTDVARSSMVVFVREGASKPEIGSVEAFKRALLAAGSISYPDPARGGLSGIFFSALLERLSIVEKLKPKTKLGRNTAATVELVASGNSELGVSQFSEIRGSGIDFVGPLPRELDSGIVISAAILKSAQDSNSAKTLIDFLSSPFATQAIKSNRLELPNAAVVR